MRPNIDTITHYKASCMIIVALILLAIHARGAFTLSESDYAFNVLMRKFNVRIILAAAKMKRSFHYCTMLSLEFRSSESDVAKKLVFDVFCLYFT